MSDPHRVVMTTDPVTGETRLIVDAKTARLRGAAMDRFARKFVAAVEREAPGRAGEARRAVAKLKARRNPSAYRVTVQLDRTGMYCVSRQRWTNAGALVSHDLIGCYHTKAEALREAAKH